MSELESLERIKAAIVYGYEDAVGAEPEYQADIALLDKLIAAASPTTEKSDE